MQYGTVQDRRHDLPGPSASIAVEKNIDKVKNYFEQNLNASIRKGNKLKRLKYRKQRCTGF